MKKINFLFLAMTSIIFAGCNKDEEIIIDNPKPESSLGYKVIEYLPAPGQFINETVSGFNDITSMEQACLQAQSRLEENKYVSLGAWGGYIIVKFDKSIVNIGGFNFAIAGNSFDTSNEPGIVWVMQDKNGNGKPDDTWFELQGSYYGKEGYQKDYWVTYFRPGKGEDTHWVDSNGEEGSIKWMGNYHNQDFYYPNWVSEDSYTLKGSKLPSRAEQNSETGMWGNLPFQWGYADNSGDDVTILEIDGKKIEVNTFRISDAIDNEGKTVALEAIDFIKVQTAIMGNASILGENSTEVCGFYRIN